MSNKTCNARAVGGRCKMPVGHNMGRLDIPENHSVWPNGDAYVEQADANPERVNNGCQIYKAN